MTEAIEPAEFDLEGELAQLLGDWVELEPSRWQRVQYALRKLDSDGPVFPTFEAFIEWVDEDTSAEWEEGEVIFLSPTTVRHQLLAGFLLSLIGTYVEQQHLGKTIFAPFKMKIPGYGAEPDVLVVLKQNESRLRKTYLDGPADLVIEVISPDSIERDRVKKFNDYEAAGVAEYWIIDPERETAEFYQLSGGHYVMADMPDGIYHSRELPGMRFPLVWLQVAHQPELLDALRSIGIL